MSSFVLLGCVDEISTNKEFEVYLDKKNYDIYLRNIVTGEIENVNSEQYIELESLICQKNKYVMKIKEFLNSPLNFIYSFFISYIKHQILSYSIIIPDIPRILKDYGLTKITSKEIVSKDLHDYIYKNNNLTDVQKEYLLDALKDFIVDYINHMGIKDIIHALNQLANIEITFEEQLKKQNNKQYSLELLGEFFCNKIIIYQDSHSVALHESIHAITSRNRKIKCCSLDEGYAVAIQAQYTGDMPYPIQNEHLLILANIIGVSNLRRYLDNQDYKGLCLKLAFVTQTNYLFVKNLIKELDTYGEKFIKGYDDKDLLLTINKKLYNLSIKVFGTCAKKSFYLKNLLTGNYKLLSPFYEENKCYEITNLQDEIIKDERIKQIPNLLIVNNSNHYYNDSDIMLETLSNDLYQEYSFILENYKPNKACDKERLSYLINQTPAIEEIRFLETVPIKVYEDKGIYYHYYEALDGTNGEIRYCYINEEGKIIPYIGTIETTYLTIDGVEKRVFLVKTSLIDLSNLYQNATITISYQKYLSEKAQTLSKIRDTE